jgi:hypothetical protein
MNNSVWLAQKWENLGNDEDYRPIPILDMAYPSREEAAKHCHAFGTAPLEIKLPEGCEVIQKQEPSK